MKTIFNFFIKAAKIAAIAAIIAKTFQYAINEFQNEFPELKNENKQ